MTASPLRAEPMLCVTALSVAGLPITLDAEPWGARTFPVADADGNLVLFAGRG